jgi:hypothetical protein
MIGSRASRRSRPLWLVANAEETLHPRSDLEAGHWDHLAASEVRGRQRGACRADLPLESERPVRLAWSPLAHCTTQRKTS